MKTVALFLALSLVGCASTTAGPTRVAERACVPELVYAGGVGEQNSNEVRQHDSNPTTATPVMVACR